MTAQEWRQQSFNTVVTHLLKQNRKSEDRGTGCKYRGPEGTKCAVGVLIPDDQYRVVFERWGLAGVCDEVPALQGTDLTFLRALQRIHDCFDPDQWAQRFKDYATAHGLTFPEGG